MARSLLLLIPLLLVGVCNAELPSERYWHKVMPNTPIPDAVRVFMFPDIDDEKVTSVDVGKGGVHVDAGKAQPKGTSVDVGKGGVNVNAHGGTNVNVGPNGKPGVYVYTPPHHGQPVIVKVGHSPFDYRYAAEQDQIHDDPSVAYFFLEKDLHANKKINIQFMKTTPGVTFLPRKSANAIPFSSTKYSEILTHFSLVPGSVEAITMKQTLKQCEEPAIQGESKYCATSLESMVDFTTSKLGTTDVRVLTTKVDSKKSPKQIYTIAEAPIKVEATKSVACHSQSYAYAVFYCHETRATKAYLVPLVGEDGSKVEAVAVCHKDTSAWNPKHLAFQVLKIKPGTVPVCHFLPQDHLVWVPTSNKS